MCGWKSSRKIYWSASCPLSVDAIDATGTLQLTCLTACFWSHGQQPPQRGATRSRGGRRNYRHVGLARPQESQLFPTPNRWRPWRHGRRLRSNRSRLAHYQQSADQKQGNNCMVDAGSNFSVHPIPVLPRYSVCWRGRGCCRFGKADSVYWAVEGRILTQFDCWRGRSSWNGTGRT